MTSPTQDLVDLFNYVSITEEGFAIVKDDGSDVIPVAFVSLNWDDKPQVLFGIRNLSLPELNALAAYGYSIDPEVIARNEIVAKLTAATMNKPSEVFAEIPFMQTTDCKNYSYSPTLSFSPPLNGLFADIRDPHDQ